MNTITINAKYSILYLLVLGFSSLLITSCDDNSVNGTDDSDDTKTSEITMSLKTTGGDETEFIISEEDIMSEEISAEGTGIGWQYTFLFRI